MTWRGWQHSTQQYRMTVGDTSWPVICFIYFEQVNFNHWITAMLFFVVYSFVDRQIKFRRNFWHTHLPFGVHNLDGSLSRSLSERWIFLSNKKLSFCQVSSDSSHADIKHTDSQIHNKYRRVVREFQLYCTWCTDIIIHKASTCKPILSLQDNLICAIIVIRQVFFINILI